LLPDGDTEFVDLGQMPEQSKPKSFPYVTISPSIKAKPLELFGVTRTERLKDTPVPSKSTFQGAATLNG
jgi:hypothetical protein